MALDVTRMVNKGHLIHADVKQYADLLTGVMTDQAVTLNNDVFAAELTVGGTLAVYGGPSTFMFGASMSSGAWTGNGTVPPGGASGQVLSKSAAGDYALAWTTPATGVSWPLLAPDGSAAAPSYAFASNSGTGIYSNGVALGITTGGTFRAFFGGSISFNAPLQFSTDNTYDIGAPSSARPRSIYAMTSVSGGSGTTLTTIGQTAAAGAYLVGSNFGGVIFGSGSTAYFSMGPNNLAPFTDNTKDLGTSSQRMKDGYFAGTLTVTTAFVGPGAVPTGGTAGQVLSKVDATNYNLAWITPGGGVTWPLLAPNGSTSAPSYSFSAAPTAGMSYSSGGAGVMLSAGNGNNYFLVNIGGFSSAFEIYGAGYNAGNASPVVLALSAGSGGFPTTGTGSNSLVTLSYKTSGSASLYTVGNGASLRIYGPSVGSNNTLTIYYGLLVAGGGSLGGGATIGTAYGINVANQGLAGVANAYGVYIAAQSGASTANIGLYNAGTTQFVGNVGIGVAPVTYSGLIFQPTMSGANQFALYAPLTFSTTGTGNTFVFYTLPTYAASTRTVASGASFYADTPTLGAGVTVTGMYGLFVGNQGRSGVTNAYGIYINPQSGATTNNVAIQTNGPVNVFGGRTNFGGTNSGDQHYFILFATTPPPTSGLGGMLYSDQTGLRIEYWGNSLATGSVTGMFAAVLGGAGSKTSFANGIQIGNPGNQGSGIGTSTGLRIDNVVSGSDNNYEIWLGIPSGSGGDNKSIVFGNSGEYIRNPKNSVNNLSIESSDGYVGVSGKAGAVTAQNAYWDGTNWQRFDVSSAASYASVGAGFTVAYAAAGANPITWTNSFWVDTGGNAVATGNLTANGSYLYLGNAGDTYMSRWNVGQFRIHTTGGLTVNGPIAIEGANTLTFSGTGQALSSSGAQLATNGDFSVGQNLIVQYNTIYLFGDLTRKFLASGPTIVYGCGASGDHSFQFSAGGFAPCTAAAFTPGSARKLKTDIRLLEEPLEIVMDERVHAVRYTTRTTGEPSVGFVADDWQEVLPEVVSLDNLGEVMALDYDRISAVTFEALKQYIARSEARFAALEKAA